MLDSVLAQQSLAVGQGWVNHPGTASLVLRAVLGAIAGALVGVCVAMIGAIVLTLKHKPHVRRQSVTRQVGRRRKDSVAVISVPTGEGISE